MKVTNQYAKTEVSMKKWAIFQNVNTKKKMQKEPISKYILK